jgi:hypothetical protein
MIPPLFGKQEVGKLTGQKMFPTIWGIYRGVLIKFIYMKFLKAPFHRGRDDQVKKFVYIWKSL